MLECSCIFPPEGSFLSIAAESLHPDKTSPKTLPYWGNFLPIAAESLPRRVSRSPATLRHGSRDTSSLYPPQADTARWFPKNAGRNPWFLHLLCCVLHPVEEDGVHLHYIALSFRWNLYRQSKGIFIRGPRQNKRFVGERRHSTVIDACRLRRAERYKACVDDMPFDCPLRPRAEGVEIGFYLIITDVPLCCAVCPVPT